MEANLLVGSQPPGKHVTLRYIDGKEPPRFPVPAIREHFEFGWSLSDCEPVLMHVVQGPYPG